MKMDSETELMVLRLGGTKGLTVTRVDSETKLEG